MITKFKLFEKYDKNYIYNLISNMNIKNSYGKDFFEILDDNPNNLDKNEFIRKYPDKYKEYLKNKKVRKFKI